MCFFCNLNRRTKRSLQFSLLTEDIVKLSIWHQSLNQFHGTLEAEAKKIRDLSDALETMAETLSFRVDALSDLGDSVAEMQQSVEEQHEMLLGALGYAEPAEEREGFLEQTRQTRRKRKRGKQ